MVRRLAAALVPAGAILASSAISCSHEWDAFDPRLGGPGGGGAAGVGGGATSASTGSTMTVSSTSGSPTSTSTASSGSTGGGGSGPGTVEYTAAVADCINPTDPDPDDCALEVGDDKMTVDTEFDPFNDPTPRHVYLRFDLDGAIAGKVVDAVTVRLHVPNANGANSDNSGDMWAVAPFDRAALFVAAPNTQGADPICPDPGVASLGADVLFPLPADAVAAGGSVYLGILPNNTNGVDYQNGMSSDPPVLVIDYH